MTAQVTSLAGKAWPRQRSLRGTTVPIRARLRLPQEMGPPHGERWAPGAGVQHLDPEVKCRVDSPSLPRAPSKAEIAFEDRERRLLWSLPRLSKKQVTNVGVHQIHDDEAHPGQPLFSGSLGGFALLMTPHRL
uniref:Uncharacterized protein n=1 Tax=Sphaerodactylus townsendi TaxID=933632 RepID=A0ACB8FLD0_9SAUR